VTVPTGTTGYGYDPAGNRLTRTRNGTPTSYAYDRADRITSAGGVGYTVNAVGNLTARGGDSFDYDQVNRLTSATVTGATSTYAYDGDGKRASSTVNSATTRYVYDTNKCLPRLLEDGARKYVWGAGLAYATDLVGVVQAVYHADGLGSVRVLTIAAGAVVQTYQTDEFGIPTQTTGSIQPFGYTGEQRDAETGFYYLRARIYDPTVGRFLQRDRERGTPDNPLSLHRHTYVENDPINRVDPSGLIAARVPETYPTSLLLPVPLPPIPWPRIVPPPWWPCIPPFCFPASIPPPPPPKYMCTVTCVSNGKDLNSRPCPYYTSRTVLGASSEGAACGAAEAQVRTSLRALGCPVLFCAKYAEVMTLPN
jgi:RHS repeat-associated protein